MKVNTLLLDHLFAVTVIFLSVVNTKAQLENIPYCKRDKMALACYNFKSFPSDIKNNLINLEALYITGNAIKTIKMGAFAGANKVKYLHLERNEIEEIDLRVFKDLSNLEELHLDENPLKGFSNGVEFPKLNLTLLDLANCRIHSIPINLFKNLEKLKTLYLHNNKLQVLDYQALLPLKSLDFIYFGGNSFNCDCQVKLLLDFLDKKNVTWHYYYISKSCQNASTLTNKNQIGVEWVKIDRELLVCSSEISSVSLKLIIAVLAALLELLLGVIITSGIYIYVRYSKIKRTELPSKIYLTIPHESKPNTASEAEIFAGDSPYPPLLVGVESEQEIFEEDEDHIYEIPGIPLTKPHE